MEKYLATVLIALSTSVTASTGVATTPIICTDKYEFARVIGEQYQEVPLVRGISVRVMEGENVSYPLVVFYNFENRTFTIAEKRGEQICAIAAGDQFEPLDENGEPIGKPKEEFKGT